MTTPFRPERVPYEKNGHMVIDTPALDASGHVPTHRMDQDTNRYPGESWEDYQRRVLTKTSFSPDTARVSSVSALDSDVADSTRSLLRDAAANGIHLEPVETRRSQERQEMLFQKGRTAPGDVATWTLTSDHTPGRAVDFAGNPSAFQWLQQHAPVHGFSVMGAMDPGHVAMPSPQPEHVRTPHGSSGTWGDAQVTPPSPPVRLSSVVMARTPAAPPTQSPPMKPAPPDETDPLDALKAMKAQRAPTAGHASDDPLEQLKATTAPGGHDIHREYASGRLAGRMARENANEAEAAASDGADSRLGAFGQSVAATGATIAQGIPGMRRLQAYTGMAASHVMGDHPLSYQQSLDALDSATGKIPGALSVAERAAGGAPLAMLLPGSAAASGAMVGAADQALSADPQSLTSRGLRTAAGAAGGALVGKLGEKLVTGAKALLPSRLGGVGEGADAALIRMQGERAQRAATLYAQAIAEGKGGAIAPHIHDFLAEDDIAPIVAKIRGGRTGATMDTPELLDRVYKELSDMQRAAARPLAGVDPSKPNAAVSQLANIKAAKQKFLNVVSRPGQKPPITMDVAPEVYDMPPTVLQPERATMDGPVGTGPLSARTSPANPTLSQGLRNFHGETPNAVQGPDGPAFQMRGQAERVRPGARIETPAMRVQTAPAEDVPPLMPSYQQAVEDYAKRTQDIQALKRGYAALKQNGTGDLPAVNALGRKTPLALADWAKGASPEEIAAARRGVLGGVRDATALGGKTLRRGRQYNAAAAPLLRTLETPGQDFTEALQNLGLLTTGNTVTRP